MQHQDLLRQTLEKIGPVDAAAEAASRRHWDGLCKPPGSLGKLEDMVSQLWAIAGKKPALNRRCVLIFCADNGVALDGVASAPQSVTLMQTINFTKGITGVAVLAKWAGAGLRVVDVGVAQDFEHPGVINEKIRLGTNSIARGPAMSREEALAAICAGIRQATLACQENDILGIGEMGIGNTTTSSAVLSSLTGALPSRVVGRGAGLSDEGLALKESVIQGAVARCAGRDVIDTLAMAGGLDLCAMCGAFLGCAAAGKPVVIDGFISAVAALCSLTLSPQVRPYLFASHASAEPGFAIAMDALQMTAPLRLDMRLGEGSGCPLLFMTLDAALVAYEQISSFGDAMLDEKYLQAIGKMGG